MSPQNSFLCLAPRIKTFEKAVLTRQLSILLSAGMPLIHALDTIAEAEENFSMKKMLLNLRNNIANGSSLAQSLKQHPRYFDPLFCQLIRSAEQSGTLDIMLKRLADHLEKTNSLKKKIKKALTYPAAILVLTILVAVFLMIFIVPEFDLLFSSFNTQLPSFTRGIILISHGTQDYGWCLLPIIALSIYLFKIIKKHSSSFNRFIDKMILKIILVGPLTEKAMISRLCRTLAILLNAGTPVIEALSAVSNTASNSHYRIAFEQIRQKVISGQRIHIALRETELFPSLVTQMIRVGEETGSLTFILNKIADYYEEELDQNISYWSQLMEPLIMLILGFVVGSFVIAMYMPIFRLGSIF
jgi:type IV pilus assembly protein PilC